MTSQSMRRPADPRFRAAFAGLTLALATACASVNSTPDAPQILPEERQRAAQMHPQILAEFGGEYDSPASAYVTRIGNQTAAAAGVPGLCNFTVINTDVINAFAVPGCYIYITRGLLAVMNSEDELASVLGHEVGHVVADHSDRRANRGTLAGLGTILVGVLSGSGELMNAAGQAAQVWTLGYSRAQEYESDDLGIRYMLANGYNPYAAADMLGALGAASSLDALTKGRQDAEAIPEWSRTHPLSENRVRRALANANATGVQQNAIPEKVSPFLAATNGMIFGDDPEQGFILGRTFAHPTLKLAFEAPEGFSLTNSPQAVLISGPNNQRALFSGGRLEGDIGQYTQTVLQNFLGETQAQVGQMQTANIHGFQTARLPARVQNSQGQMVDVAVTAYRFQPESAFHFVTLAPANGGQDLAPLLSSFRGLSDTEAAALKPRRIQLVTVGNRDSIASIAQRMAYDDYKEDRFRVLNGLGANDTVQPGQQVKIVVFGN